MTITLPYNTGEDACRVPTRQGESGNDYGNRVVLVPRKKIRSEIWTLSFQGETSSRAYTSRSVCLLLIGDSYDCQ